MEKDFFDEELEKQEQEQERRKQMQEDARRHQIDDWYHAGPSNGGATQKTSNNRALYVTLVCIGLVLTFIFGWVLCSIFNSQSSSTTGVLDEVFRYLDTEYYKEISDQQIMEAIAAGGTAILQSAGDQYCQLLTPQQAYNLIYPSEGGTQLSGTYFGMSYSPSSIGLYVSDVSADSSSYGVLQSGDVIVKLTQMADADGNAVTYNGQQYNQIAITDLDSDQISAILLLTNSANFHYLRGGELHQTGIITRGKIGVHPLQTPSATVTTDYNFVEYYCVGANGHAYSNLSLENQNNAKHNTYELRQLSRIPAGVGYVRIDQFMYVYDQLTQKKIGVADEFKSVLELFRTLGLNRIVLDLKGNPGGSVGEVCDIAGMLVTSDKLTEQQKKSVTEEKTNNLLITSLIPRETASVNPSYYKVQSTYSTYFNPVSDVCDIVVWTDGGSASASELLTGALLDYGTGFQMGTRTYGKGIAQSVVRLTQYPGKVTVPGTNRQTTEYWCIYYTFAAYYSPLGSNIHGVGYTPTEGYDGLESYSELWDATYRYWSIG